MAKYIRYQTGENSAPVYGRVEGDTVHALVGDIFGEIVASGETLPLADVTLLTPCDPSKIIAIGFNYGDHAAEFNTPIPTAPNVFMKPISALTAANTPVYYPSFVSERVEYETELVIVIGKETRHVTEEEALDYVLGYTIGNDVSARTLQSPTGQWCLAKGFDTFAPLGPWIVTDVDPKAGLAIQSFVNGEPRQTSNTKHLIFDVAYLVSYLSQAMTFHPGDIIYTGTPAGVGPIFPGDTMEMRIEGIGSLVNPVVAEG